MHLFTGSRIAFIGIGAGLMYLFDPHMGRTRRARLAQQLGGKARRGVDELTNRRDYVAGHVEGLRHTGRNLGDDTPPENDPALVAKIESEVLSRWSFPKGNIVVNAEEGVVSLRGTCDTSDQIDELEQEVRKISGVIDVRNYLHLPNTPAPNKRDAIDAR